MRAATPALVVAIHVRPGDRVVAGQLLGFLEAMKMEIGFSAPVAGVVTEMRVRRRASWSPAGDVLVVIEPDDARSGDGAEGAAAAGAERRGRSAGRCSSPVRPPKRSQRWTRGRRHVGRARWRRCATRCDGVLLGYDADPDHGRTGSPPLLASAEPAALSAAAAG